MPIIVAEKCQTKLLQNNETTVDKKLQEKKVESEQGLAYIPKGGARG